MPKFRTDSFCKIHKGKKHVLKYFPAILLIVDSFMGFLFICSDV